MIRFRYQPTFEDWFALNRMVVLRQFRFLVWLALVLLALFLIYPFMWQALGHRLEGGVLGVYRNNLGLLFIPGLTCFLLVATYFGVRKRWMTADEIREAREYVFDDSGVRVNGASQSSYLEWRHFKHAELKRGYFILKTAQNQYHYFPASVVSDAAKLHELVASKVSARRS
jgi:hypothetical protein